MVRLGVNIDHVATIRQARMAAEPDPVWAASICELAGCHSIVVHLRQDRRHINELDVKKLKDTVKTRLNLEMSVANEIVSIACKIKPYQSTLVPEKRRELTTEGGLDVVKHKSKVKKAVNKLQKNNIKISLFIDPDKRQIKASRDLEVDSIEIHTGKYANAKNKSQEKKEFTRIEESVRYAKSLDLKINAGHGLTYQNTRKIACIHDIEELNIGHSIVSRAVLVGLEKAIKEMLELINGTGFRG